MIPLVKADNVNELYTYEEGIHAGHRPPYSAGDADRSYGRPCEPNFCYKGTRLTIENMTPWQIREYVRGYEENPTDQKEN